MSNSNVNSEIFNRLLVAPSAVMLIVSLLFCNFINSITPAALIEAVPGIMRFSAITEFSDEAKSMWSIFWISTPVFFVLTIYISIFARVEKKAGVLFNLLCSAFCALTLLMIGLFLYYGPSPDPDPGPKTTLYQHSYLFFMVLSWSVWIGPYALLYGFLKGIFVNFEK